MHCDRTVISTIAASTSIYVALTGGLHLRLAVMACEQLQLLQWSLGLKGWWSLPPGPAERQRLLKDMEGGCTTWPTSLRLHVAKRCLEHDPGRRLTARTALRWLAAAEDIPVSMPCQPFVKTVCRACASVCSSL